MNDAKNKENGIDRLTGLSDTLVGVENKLLHRALDRSRDEVEGAYDFINQAADAGVVDIACLDYDGSEAVVGGEGEGEDEEVEPNLPHMTV